MIPREDLLDSIFFFEDTAPTEIYPYCPTLALHDALPISAGDLVDPRRADPLRPAFRPAYGGITLVIGDSHASLNARGDLILAGVGDPGDRKSTRLNSSH